MRRERDRGCECFLVAVLGVFFGFFFFSYAMVLVGGFALRGVVWCGVVRRGVMAGMWTGMVGWMVWDGWMGGFCLMYPWVGLVVW